jgi:hypothetical protein
MCSSDRKSRIVLHVKPMSAHHRAAGNERVLDGKTDVDVEARVGGHDPNAMASR